MKKPLMLMIMDGFGFAPAEGNAIKAANTPNLDKLFSENPLTQIGASGMDVGLPDGQMGNSERSANLSTAWRRRQRSFTMDLMWDQEARTVLKNTAIWSWNLCQAAAGDMITSRQPADMPVISEKR